MATSEQEVLERVRRFATARREQFSSTLSWFILERFMPRLAVSAAHENLALHGDLMIHALMGGAPPYEWRAELQRLGKAGSPDALALVKEVCAHMSNDFLRYEAKALPVIDPPKGAAGSTRLFGLTGLLGPTECTVKLLIHEAEAMSLRPADYHFRSSIEGLDGGRVKACPPPVVVAHLLYSLIGNGVAPGRQASYRGLRVLLESAQITEVDAVAAIRSVFSSRGASVPVRLPLALSEEIAANATKEQVWQAFQARARVTEPPFENTVRVLREALWPWLQQAYAEERS